MIELYTDGAYAPSRNQGGWAFVVVIDGLKTHYDFNLTINTTNNRMEITSIIEGILYLKSINVEEFIVYSDSLYVINTMLGINKKKKNTDLWEELDECVKGLNISWKHVKGHAGNKFNEECDKYAVLGTQLISRDA